jgi:hypothetical protein
VQDDAECGRALEVIRSKEVCEDEIHSQRRQMREQTNQIPLPEILLLAGPEPQSNTHNEHDEICLKQTYGSKRFFLP